eukprot:scaffold248353_cov71-Cyclotella_meneghiniana.AAC.6
MGSKRTIADSGNGSGSRGTRTSTKEGGGEEEMATYEGMLVDCEEEANKQTQPHQEPPPEQEIPPATPPKTPTKVLPRKGPRIENKTYIKNPEISKAIKRVLINPSKFGLGMLNGFTPKQQLDIIVSCAAASLAIYSMRRDKLQISNDEVELGCTSKEDLVKWIKREDLARRKVADYETR